MTWSDQQDQEDQETKARGPDQHRNIFLILNISSDAHACCNHQKLSINLRASFSSNFREHVTSQ